MTERRPSRSITPLPITHLLASSGGVNVWVAEQEVSKGDIAIQTTCPMLYRGAELWLMIIFCSQTVCKHYSCHEESPGFSQELRALLAIRHAGGHKLWPELMSFNRKQKVLVSRPLADPPGDTLSISLFSVLVLTPEHTVSCLTPHMRFKTPPSSPPTTGVMNVDSLIDLLEGFRFLHATVKYIHRDIEDKHVGCSKSGQLCMFDLDTSVALDASSSSVSPEGSFSSPV